MSADDEGPRDARDLRLIWRTVTVAAIIVATVISGIVYVATWATRIEARVENVEAWQRQRDREAARELWRQRSGDRGISPGIAPK